MLLCRSQRKKTSRVLSTPVRRAAETLGGVSIVNKSRGIPGAELGWFGWWREAGKKYKMISFPSPPLWSFFWFSVNRNQQLQIKHYIVRRTIISQKQNKASSIYEYCLWSRAAYLQLDSSNQAFLIRSCSTFWLWRCYTVSSVLSSSYLFFFVMAHMHGFNHEIFVCENLFNQ